MIVWPAEPKSDKDAVFRVLATLDGGGKRLWIVPMRFGDYPETAARVAVALRRAKRQPKSVVLRWLKRQMLRGQYNWARGYFTRHPDHLAAAWNGLTGTRMAFLMGARDAGAATLHAERAPFPGRITLDPTGVNAEGSVPQDPAFFLGQPLDPDWRQAGNALTARPSRRADVGQSVAPLPDTPFLFCPLQVPNDSQVTLFAGWSGGMAGYLEALTQAAASLPPGWHLRVKEHPSARASLAQALAPLLATGRAVLDNDADSFAQLAASKGVVTLNSSMGLQAFFFDKPVICVGLAFFNLPGLTTPAGSQTALAAAFSDAPALAFDADLRGKFIGWLLRDYYPAFEGKGARHDTAHLTAFLHKARRMLDR